MWDLTHTIREDMTQYPGMPQPVLHDFATPAKDGYGMSDFSFWNHLGTHIDAPTNFYADGKNLDDFPIESFLRRVQTIHCENVPHITRTFLERACIHHAPDDALLLLTGQYQHWGTPAYFGPFPVLSDDGAAFVAEKGYTMVLVDAPSVDPVTTETYPVHRRLLQEPMLIVENLAYRPDLPETFQVIALPLKIQKSNGSPARIIATTHDLPN